MSNSNDPKKSEAVLVRRIMGILYYAGISDIKILVAKIDEIVRHGYTPTTLMIPRMKILGLNIEFHNEKETRIAFEPKKQERMSPDSKL